MAALDEAFHLVSSTFKIPELNSHQKQAIRKIVSKNLFVNLPTGFGKSLIYQALPLVFDHVIKQPGHIVVVVHLRNRTKIGYNTMVKSVIEGHKYGCLYHVIISTINDSLRFPNYSIIHFKERYKVFYVLICLFRF